MASSYTDLNALTKEQNESDARQAIKAILFTAMGHGFLPELDETKTIDGDENDHILEQLRTLHINTSASRPPFELAFHLATGNIEFSESIINIHETLKSSLETLIIMEAERNTCLNLISFIKRFAAPAKLIESDNLPKSANREEVMAALKIIKSSAAKMKHTAINLPSMINDILTKIDLNTPSAMDTANTQLQPLTLKKINETIALEAIQKTLIQYKSLFQPSYILWNSAEVTASLQIEALLANKNLPTEKKISAINNKIKSVIKEFLDGNDIINQAKLLEAPLTSIKVLAAIYSALEELPCHAVQEKINVIIDSEDTEQFLKIDDSSPKIMM